MYEKDKLFGLFNMFVTQLLEYHIMKWTNTRHEKVRHFLLAMVEFDAWIGLQLAMSIVFWPTCVTFEVIIRSLD